MVTFEKINKLRMWRQHFTTKADSYEYDNFFRDISPVPVVFWSSPGEPPTLPYHADFNDRMYNFRKRATREIIKGRYQKNLVGYINKDDIELYARLYIKPITQFTPLEIEILNLLRNEGPMSIQLMKKLTNHLIKELSPALQKLQKAYLLFEDQVDNEWDRPWYLMETEFPDFDINKYSYDEAIKEIAIRFARRMGVFSDKEFSSFYKIPVKSFWPVFEKLFDEGILINDEYGFVLKEDYELLDSDELDSPKYNINDLILVLHRNDFFVRTQETLLKDKYDTKGYKILQYVLIKGEIKGAVIGRFSFDPNYILDVVLDDDVKELSSDNKEKLLNLIYQSNSYDSVVENFLGEKL